MSRLLCILNSEKNMCAFIFSYLQRLRKDAIYELIPESVIQGDKCVCSNRCKIEEL